MIGIRIASHHLTQWASSGNLWCDGYFMGLCLGYKSFKPNAHKHIHKNSNQLLITYWKNYLKVTLLHKKIFYWIKHHNILAAKCSVVRLYILFFNTDKVIDTSCIITNKKVRLYRFLPNYNLSKDESVKHFFKVVSDFAFHTNSLFNIWFKN